MFQHLQDDSEVAALRLAEQQVEVLGHDDVAGDVEAVPSANLFESEFEDVPGVRSGQQRGAVIATTGDEVEAVRLLESLECPGNGGRIGS